MNLWMEQKGYPVIALKLKSSICEFEQPQFLSSALEFEAIDIAMLFGGADNLLLFLACHIILVIEVVVDPCAANLVFVVTRIFCARIKEGTFVKRIQYLELRSVTQLFGSLMCYIVLIWAYGRARYSINAIVVCREMVEKVLELGLFNGTFPQQHLLFPSYLHLIVMLNDKLMIVVSASTPVIEAFRLADNILRQGVRGISDIITIPGLANVAFAEMIAIMASACSSLMRIGIATGKPRARKFSLYYQRLEIVDSTSRDRFIYNEDKKFVVTVNGIIYNNEALLQVLPNHKFHTRSDCDVIAHAYGEYGENLVDMLDVIFLFVLLDFYDNSFLVACDASETTLHIGWRFDGSIWISFELKGLHNDYECFEDDTILPDSMKSFLKLFMIIVMGSEVETSRRNVEDFIVDPWGQGSFQRGQL